MGVCEVWGHVAEGFEPVRVALENNFALHDEHCAAVCVYVGGECVASLQGGQTPAGPSYTTGTRQSLLCASKGLVSLTAHHLAARGLIDLGRPVAHYWPEFGQCGKDGITVGMVLNQTSGVLSAGVGSTVADLLDGQVVIEHVAAAEPNLPPGSQHAYAFHTFGLIIGEVVRRVCGIAISEYFRKEIAEPLGLDLVLRLPEEERAAVTPILMPDRVGVRRYIAGLTDLARESLHLNGAVEISDRFFNDPAVSTAEIPGTIGYGTAAGLAGLYDAVLEQRPTGMPSPGTFDRVEVAGVDGTIGARMQYGPGFMLGGGSELGDRAQWFGFAGASGTLGFADQANGIAAAYVSNRFSAVFHDEPRTRNIVRAIYDSMKAANHPVPSGRF